jgi:C4-dicarboxylate-binding protein DctP
LSGAALALLAFAVAPAPAAAQTVYEFKLTNCSRNDPNHASLDLMKEELDKRAPGRFNVGVYPACQLGTAQRSIEGLQLGTIEMHSNAASSAAAINPNFQVPDAPGLFKDLAHAARTYQYPTFREKFVAIGEEKGIDIIGVWPHSTSSYVATAPLRRLDDFKGKKIRVIATRLELALMTAVGASGVPIDFGELLPALQARTVDGVRSTLVIMAPFKYFDVAKYATVTSETVFPIAMMTSRAFLSKLPADLRALVLQIAQETERKMLTVSEDFGARSQQAWKDGGGEIISMPEPELSEFLRRANAVGVEVLSTNPATKELYALFKEAAEATRDTR